MNSFVYKITASCRNLVRLPAYTQIQPISSCSSVCQSSGAVLTRLLGNHSTQHQQSRTRIYQSWKDAQPESDPEVPQRFKRLHNGLWIRPRAGRHRSLWKRSPETREDLRQHVICNKRQCWLLERMVGKFWKTEHHYPNDPYAPYHVRHGLPNDRAYKKNRAPFYP